MKFIVHIYVVGPEILCFSMSSYALPQLVTVFSAPNYCGEFDNAGGCLRVEHDLRCSFTIIPVSMYAHTL